MHTLTPAQITDLEIDVRRAVRAGHRDGCCCHCGRRRAALRPGHGELCYPCWQAPDDTPEALHAIDRLRALDMLEDEGL